LINRVLALALRTIIGGVSVTLVAAHAETPNPAPNTAATPAPAPSSSQSDAAKQNEEVLRAWKQQSGSAAELSSGSDGATKIEFHGEVKADYYNNDISTPAGSGNLQSPLQSGTFYKVVTRGDLRATSDQGDVSYGQATVTNSDDRAVLSRYSSQLSNFQVGQTTKTSQWMFGDVAVNYSQLSSNLGLRGVYGIKQFGSYTLSGHAGVVADSWEALADLDALDGLPARTKYLRDVYGAKLEKAFTPGLKAYVTAQSFNDRDSSVPAGSIALLPANTRAVTTGLVYQEGQFNLTSEIASSHFQEKDQDMRSGRAFIIDGNYAIDAWRFRGGYHDVSASFVSLSQGVAPGIRESYLGADWTVAAWLTVGTEYRDSNLTTASYTPLAPPSDPPQPAPAPVIGTTTLTKSLTSRANINFGPEHPGWGLTFQNTRTEVTDPQGSHNPSTNFLTTVNYSSQTWSGMFSVGQGRVTSSANPQADSTTDTLQFQIGRQFNNATPETPASWTATTSLTGGRQVQNLVNTGTSTETKNLGLVFAFQKPDSLQVNASVTESITTQPTGGPDLKTVGVQLDASYPLPLAEKPGIKVPGVLKAYARDNLRNMGDPTLRARETVVGAQINYLW
jgi:hypothetical protein